MDFTGFFLKNPVFYTVKVTNENHLRVRFGKQKFHMFQVTVTFFFIMVNSYPLWSPPTDWCITDI